MNTTFASAFAVILESLNSVTKSMLFRTWANTSTYQLIGRVNSAVTTEQAIAKAGGIDAYNALRDSQSQPDAMDNGREEPITLDQLAEFNVACVAIARTLADGFSGMDNRMAQPQSLDDAFAFMATPKTKVTEDQIEAVLEEEPSMGRDAAVALLQQMAREDAQRLMDNKVLVLERARAAQAIRYDGEKDIAEIVAALPTQYRELVLEKALGKILTELDRTLPLALKGIPGISGKRRELKQGLPQLEALVA